MRTLTWSHRRRSVSSRQAASSAKLLLKCAHWCELQRQSGRVRDAQRKGRGLMSVHIVTFTSSSVPFIVLTQSLVCVDLSTLLQSWVGGKKTLFSPSPFMPPTPTWKIRFNSTVPSFNYRVFCSQPPTPSVHVWGMPHDKAHDELGTTLQRRKSFTSCACCIRSQSQK